MVLRRRSLGEGDLNIVDLRISKARIKDGQLEVSLENQEKDTQKKTELRSMKGFHPDLQKAFDDLVPHVRTILGWPDSLYFGKLTVTGVSFSHSENTGVEGAVMVCQAGLPDGTSNSPFCFNTPHLPFEQYSEDGQSPVMPGAAITSLEDLKREVHKYLEGKRDQGDLFQPPVDEIHESKVEAAARAVGISTASAREMLREETTKRTPKKEVNVITDADLKKFRANTLKRSTPAPVDS